ncbi:MAG: right-handed parallel beta-helix repeat-containing protein, partial [Candidatus Kariarchaeaceae archaeon]
ISIYNSSFLSVHQNTVRNNSWKGIMEDSSINNTINNNHASFNGHDGIHTYNCNFSKILDNYIFNNTWNGFVSQGNSNHLEILNNEVFNNTNVGLRLEYLSFSTIDSNAVYQNDENGIWLFSSSENVVINNYVFINRWEGIHLESFSSNNLLQNNLVENNDNKGIWLQNSPDNDLVNNDLHGNLAQGILIGYSNNILIDGNVVAGSWGSGLFLSHSYNLQVINNYIHENSKVVIDDISALSAGLTTRYVNGTIIDNEIFNNYDYGLLLYFSTYFDIVGNVISDNYDTGLSLESINNTMVDSNDITTNGGAGVILNNSHNNWVGNNFITHNSVNGITIINSNYNTFENNDINANGGSTSGTPVTDPLGEIRFSIQGSTSGHGIFLDPSQANYFFNNRINDNYRSGTYLLNADGNDLSDNIISNNGENGVFLENSNDNFLYRNTINGNGGSLLNNGLSVGNIKFSIQGSTSGHGIFLDPSTGNTIIGNEISQNVLNGISLFESDNNFIERNTITKNDNGIYLEDSSWNNITRNTIAKNGEFPVGDKLSSDIKFSIKGSTSGHGIFLDPSDYNTIDHNAIFGNEKHGIYLLDSDSVIIQQNSISVNRLYGVFADLNSDSSKVNENDFNQNNFMEGSQAKDDGENGDFGGNYWSDLMGDIYYIDGLAENSDDHPADAPFFPPGYEFTSPTVIYPNGGESLSGIINVQWYEPSNEKYPDEITYWVFYSNDAGSQWFIIQFGSIGTSDPTGQNVLSLEWDTKLVEDGSEYLIQVVAVDKIGSVSSDMSDDVFQIKNGIETTTTTTTDTTTETSPSLTPAWTILGSLLSIGSYGWLSVRKSRSKKN